LDRSGKAWLLLERLLAATRLIFAGFFDSEPVHERYSLLRSNQLYSVPELSRLLSEDLTDCLKLFDSTGGREATSSPRRRSNANFSLILRNWDKRSSALSFLSRTARGREESWDYFATIHDTQVKSAQRCLLAQC
jgi:hypothetical protein